MLDEFEGKILDTAYDEFMNFSGLDSGFIHDILNAAEEDDVAYQLVLEWIRTENNNERMSIERSMSEYLLIGYLSR